MYNESAKDWEYRVFLRNQCDEKGFGGKIVAGDFGDK